MSLAMAVIIERLIARLVEDGHLLLHPGGTVSDVTDEVLLAMARRERPAQFGAFVSEVLVRSERVEELFIDDASIARMLSDL
jgi:hypothetical protein